MIFIFLFVLLISAFVYGYFVKNIKLDNTIDEVISQLHNEPLPELLKGEVGFASNGDIKICYEWIKGDVNRDEYLVLLHGLTESMITFPQFFIQDFLDEGYHIIRVDHRDSGLSTWVNNWESNKYTLEDMAEDLIAVMDELNIGQFHLVGKSMGGMIAQSIAIRYPDRVKSLTSIMSSGYFHDPALVNLPRKFAFDFALIFIAYRKGLAQIDNQLKFNVAIINMLAGKNKNTIDQKLMLQKLLYEITQRNGYNKHAQKQHSYAIKKSGSRIEALRQLNTPTFIVHGKADPLVKFEHGEKCAAIIPNAQQLFIDEMGHRLPAVYAGTITKSIIKFLNEHVIEMKDNLHLESH